MEPVTDLERSSEPHHGRGHNDRLMWVMMLGCCLAIPLALIITGVTAGALAGAKPWLLATAGALAIALVIAHRGSAVPSCHAGAADTDSTVRPRPAPSSEATRGDAS